MTIDPANRFRDAVRQRRLGQFHIPYSMFQDDDLVEQFARIQNDVLIVKAEFCHDPIGWSYVGYSPKFPPCPEGYEAPRVGLIEVPDGLFGWRFEFETAL